MLYVSLSINSIFQVIFFIEFFFIKIYDTYVTTHTVTRILRIKNKENGKKKYEMDEFLREISQFLNAMLFLDAVNTKKKIIIITTNRVHMEISFKLNPCIQGDTRIFFFLKKKMKF